MYKNLKHKLHINGKMYIFTEDRSFYIFEYMVNQSLLGGGDAYTQLNNYFFLPKFISC